jgi:type I restriction enzyme S subunit
VSAVLTAQEPSAKYLANLQPPLVRHFDLIAQAPGGVARLRELILTLAVQGKLVPQDPSDEPASELLKKIRAEKDRLIADGKIKRDKPLAEIEDGEKPFELPASWTWTRFGDVSINRDGERIPVSSSDRESRAKIYDYYGASGVIDKIDGYLFEKTLLLIGEDGANLINRSTPIAFLAHGKYWVNNHAHVIDATHHQLLDYLALFINSISLRPYVTGTAQPKMNQAKLNSILVAVPPLAEQSRIVTRVEELMQVCDALEASGQLEAQQHAQLVNTLLGTLTQSETPEALADNWQRIATHFDVLLDRPEAVDALEQTILQLAVRGLLVPQDPTDEPASVLLQKIRIEKDHLIAQGKIKRDKPLPPITDEEKPFELPQGWEWIRLSNLLPEFQNGASSRGDKGGRSVTVLRLADIKNRRISLEDTRQIPINERDIQKYQVQSGDILITRVNGSADIVGQFNLCDRSVDAIYCDHFIRLRVNPSWLDPLFATLLGESDLVRQKIKAMFITTAGQKTVNQAHIGSLLFPLPPLVEQFRIVTRVNNLRSLCAVMRTQIQASQEVQGRLAMALIDKIAQ